MYMIYIYIYIYIDPEPCQVLEVVATWASKQAFVQIAMSSWAGVVQVRFT
jgi:hypothetical protein